MKASIGQAASDPLCATDGSTASRWPAPAKLNLFLHVLGRRADGFHALQTVFQLLDFGDEVELAVRADGMLRMQRPVPGVAPEDDLAMRAAALLKRATRTSLGADIGVLKRTPMGGGMGGGSSDAATVLVALDTLWGTGLGEDALAALALELGADVPVFVRGRSAWAEGVGETLVPLDLPPRWYAVVDPGVSTGTAAVFAAAELTRDTPPTTIARLLSGEPTRNDLEPVVCARYPRVAQARAWLGSQAPARMTGSGACVFAALDSRAEAERIARNCPAGFTAFVARGINESPLQGAVARWRERHAARE